MALRLGPWQPKFAKCWMGVTQGYLDQPLTLAERHIMSNEQLYGDLPKVSDKIRKRCLQFAGHCVRSSGQVVSDLVLSKPAETYAWQKECWKTNHDACRSSVSGHRTNTSWNQDMHGEQACLESHHWCTTDVDGVSEWVSEWVLVVTDIGLWWHDIPSLYSAILANGLLYGCFCLCKILVLNEVSFTNC